MPSASDIRLRPPVAQIFLSTNVFPSFAASLASSFGIASSAICNCHCQFCWCLIVDWCKQHVLLHFDNRSNDIFINCLSSFIIQLFAIRLWVRCRTGKRTKEERKRKIECNDGRAIPFSRCDNNTHTHTHTHTQRQCTSSLNNVCRFLTGPDNVNWLNVSHRTVISDKNNAKTSKFQLTLFLKRSRRIKSNSVIFAFKSIRNIRIDFSRGDRDDVTQPANCWPASSRAFDL